MKKLLLLFTLLITCTLSHAQVTGLNVVNFTTNDTLDLALIDGSVSRINIVQTTPSITIAVPVPTFGTTKVVEKWIGNKGTVSFTLRALPDIDGFVVDTGQAVILKWIGAKYVVIGKAPASASIIAEAPLSYINDTLKIDTTKVPYFSGGIPGPKNSSTYLNGVGVWDTINVGVTSVTGATNRITSTGGATPVIDIDASYVGQSSITTVGTIGTGVWNAGAVTSSGSIIGLNYNATGSGGAGYLQLPFQTATPTAVSGSMIIYSNGSNRFSIVRRNNANSADITRTHIYPDASYDWTFPTPASGSSSTLAGLNTAQDFTSVNRFSNTNGTELYSLKIFDVAAGTYDNAIDAPSGNQLRINGLGANMGILLNSNTFTNGISFAASFNAQTGGANATIGNTSLGLLATSNSRSGASSLKSGFAIVSGNHTGAVSGANTQDISYITGSSTSASGTSSTTGSHLFDVGTVAGTGTRGGVSFFNGFVGAINTEPAWNSGQRIMFIGNRTASPTGNPTAGFYLWGESGDATIRSSGGGITSIGTAGVSMQVAGQGLLIKEGTNATLGTATLVGGTITISTTKVTANSRIFVTIQSPSGTPGAVYVSARTAGTSFDITSTRALDTSVVAWFIVEPN